jgi:hypothetical protein
MAFLRWRGRCCELFATVYENDRPSRQVVLAKFHDLFVDKWTKEKVTEKFPGIKIDWLAVDRALAQGPPEGPTRKKTPQRLNMAAVAHYLHRWADDAEKANMTKEAGCLRLAANILTGMRAEFHRANSHA